jgi:hypothetical protein
MLLSDREYLNLLGLKLTTTQPHIKCQSTMWQSPQWIDFHFLDEIGVVTGTF